MADEESANDADRDRRRLALLERILAALAGRLRHAVGRTRRPFPQAILAAGLLAFLLVPVSDRFASRLGPTVGTLLTIVLFVGPVVLGLALSIVELLVEECEERNVD